MSVLQQHVLVVDDNAQDRMFASRAFRKLGLEDRLRLAADGGEACDYLSGKGHYADRLAYPIPALVFLDLEMPEMSGLSVLKWIRSQPGLCHTVIIIFSSSTSPGDVLRAYQCGASSYLTKPCDQHSFPQLLWVTLEYWLKTNLLAGPISGSRSP